MFSLCILMAGQSQRTGLSHNKNLHYINGIPLFMYSIKSFLECEDLGEIILVVNEYDYDNYFSKECWENVISSISIPIKVLKGSNTRSKSSYIGINASHYDVVFVHDAARPLIKSKDIIEMHNLMKSYDAVISGSRVYDTIKDISEDKAKQINRDNLFASSTPQAIRKSLYLKYYNQETCEDYTDEAMLMETNNFNIYYYYLSSDNRKVTTIEDLEYVEYKLTNLPNQYKIGHSKDTHRLVEGRKFVLGGIEIDYHMGFLAHSDGDVLLHAITEAIIGSLGLGDIGKYFSDKDPQYKDKDSKFFLIAAKQMLEQENYEIVNIDSIVYLEKPNLSKYKDLIKKNIANILSIDSNKVNVKATTKEGLGLIGEGKAAEAEAVVLIRKLI